MNNYTLILILILVLIFCVVLVNANDIYSNSTTTYLRRNLVHNNSNLCTCDKVLCGLCMSGCSPSTSNDCQRGRNWCYCNVVGTDCLENKYEVCGLQPTTKPTLKPTPGPTSKPTHLPTRPTSKPTFSPTMNPTFSPTSLPSSLPTLPPTLHPTSIPTLPPTALPTPVDTSTGPSTIFTYTGSTQSYTVPAGVTTLSVKLWGAGGGGAGRAAINYGGGSGGFTTCTLSVIPNEILNIVVGGAGKIGGYSSIPYGGFGGGGAGVALRDCVALVGGGGGRSSIQRNNDDIVTAGGIPNLTFLQIPNLLFLGGGGGGISKGGLFNGGGAGGGLSGLPSKETSSQGSGGTQTSGGKMGTGVNCNGGDGSKYQGGKTSCTCAAGGGYNHHNHRHHQQQQYHHYYCQQIRRRILWGREW